jgi:hypothetical protein
VEGVPLDSAEAREVLAKKKENARSRTIMGSSRLKAGAKVSIDPNACFVNRHRRQISKK